MEEMIKLALECGFTAAAGFDPQGMEFRTEVRDMCAADKCHNYNKSWSCPPACGTLEEISAKALQYKRGVILQTTGKLEDSFDFEGMKEASRKQKESFSRFAERIRQECPGAMLMGTGGCTSCAKCTYPDEPCRFPDRKTVSMEACGLVVSDVCKLADIPYYYGPGTLTYCACVLF